MSRCRAALTASPAQCCPILPRRDRGRSAGGPARTRRRQEPPRRRSREEPWDASRGSTNPLQAARCALRLRGLGLGSMRSSTLIWHHTADEGDHARLSRARQPYPTPAVQRPGVIAWRGVPQLSGGVTPTDGCGRRGWPSRCRGRVATRSSRAPTETMARASRASTWPAPPGRICRTRVGVASPTTGHTARRLANPANPLTHP